MARTVIIDFTKSDPFIDDAFLGYIGEHNETVLSVTPPDEMLDDPNVATFTVAFGTGGKVYHSPVTTRAALTPPGYFTTPLFKDVTGDEELAIQLEAYDLNATLLAKTEVIYGYLEPSVDGVDAVADANPGIIADIAANTAARHTHANKALLDDIPTPEQSDVGKALTVGANGLQWQSAGGGLTEHVVVYDEETFAPDHLISLFGNELIIYDDITAEGKPLHNGRITDIELLVGDEWLSLWRLIAISGGNGTLAVPIIFTKPIVEDNSTIVGAVNVDFTDTYYPTAIKIHYITIMEASSND